MNKLFSLLFASCVTTTAIAGEFFTAGDGQKYTFKSIANFSPETVIVQGNIYTVLQDFTISEEDTLLLLDGEQICLADGVCITINGVMDFRPSTSALVTRVSKESQPKGFCLASDNAEMFVSNVTFEYVAFSHMSQKPIEAHNCTFRYANTSLTNTAAIAFLNTTKGNIISGCRFIQNESSAIGGSATNGTGLLIENCYFYDNNTSNVNKPQLNLTSGGEDDIVIRNNTFIGTGRDMVGAIGFMNYYVDGPNKIRIENNIIQGHRYGIAAYSFRPLNFEIINNTIIGNRYESNPNNGGSGISLYDNGTSSLNAYAEGNLIEDNLWGVTVLGNIGIINFGKTENPIAIDYNPGRNTFRNNGFDGVIYDFFNNTSNDATIYAQGNIWNSVSTQDSASIATVVWDNHDQGGHGEVIFASNPQAKYTIGYSTGEMGRTTVCRMGSSKQQGLAIKLSRDKLQPLIGKTISNIKVAFGSRNTTGKVATLFVTDDLDAEIKLRTQEVNIASANKWQVNELEHPYTITGEEEALYVGYYAEIGTTYNILQCDFTNELRDCTFALNNGHWTDLFGSGFGSANIYVGFKEPLEFADVMLAETDLSSRYYISGQPYQEATHIFNFGTTPITKLQLTLLKDGERSTNVIEDIYIQQFGTYEIQLPELLASESGSSSISATIEVLNAVEPNLSDNEFQSSAFFYPANIERSIFVEEFTGQTCPNCPAGKTTLNAAVEQSGLPCVEIMHHSGYSADSFTTDADAECTWFYGSNSTYAPAAMFNRLTNPAVGSVPVQNVGLELCLSSLEYASKQQPYVSMALTSAFNAETRMVDVSLDLLDHNTLPGQTVLNVYLIQDSIIANQSGASAEYRHDGVLRKVLTGSVWGLILPDTFVPGATQQYTVSYELPDAIYSDYYSGSNPQYLIPTDPEHMRIVAYVANYDSRDYNNNVVHNCIEVPLVNGSYTQRGMTTGLEAIESDAQPARAGIFDLNGRQYEADAQLPAGLYIVNGKKMLICK